MNRIRSGTALLVLLLAVSLPAPAFAAFTEFAIPTATSGPRGITVGPDGALWFTERVANKVGRVTTSGSFTEFPAPDPSNPPLEITTGPDGALWFTEINDKVGRLTTTGSFTEFQIGSSPRGLGGITTGPDGALWFTEQVGAASVGRITTAGSVTEFPTPSSNFPQAITAGPDGALWFTEWGSAGQIGRITTAGVITEFPLPDPNSAPFSITAGPDGALWFTQGNIDKIGRITTSGTITEFAIPTANSGADGITAGPDGALWFTEYAGNRIGRITTSGDITEIPTPNSNSAPTGITAGPDGAIWFNEANANAVARLTTSYVRPKGATPFVVSLVPAYAQCTFSNRQHGAPLDAGSCKPPQPASGFLTVGTPDANGAPANGIGSVRYRVKVNAPPTPSDVLINVSTTDVRCQLPASTTCGSSNAAAGPDYTGQLQVTMPLRLTDKFNGPDSGGGTQTGTVADNEFPVTVQCSATTSTSIGAACTIATSANAVMPGSVQTDARAIWQAGPVKVFDGGSAGTAGASDATLFEHQGLFVP